MTASQDTQPLINRLEEFARNNPGAYRFRVMLVAALGYGYLLAVVIGLLVTVYLVVWAMIAFGHALLFKLVWVPLVLAWLVLKSMWITIPPPDGMEIEREQAPKLFNLIGEVRTSLAGPEVHRVLISDEFNAGIVQVPKFGMFGWTTNYLVIGLQLLKAIGPDEFRAVIAHEFGHLSGKHGRFSGWIYRIRESWIQILTNVRQERHYASFIFDWFINWYAPYFNAYSFVLARAQEYEADRYSVETSGKTVAARALVQLEAKGRALQEELWPKFYRQASDQPQAPKNPFALMLGELERPLAPVKVERWLRQSLKVQTGYDDTHPALAERLEGLGFTREAQTGESMLQELGLNNEVSLNVSAADHFLEAVPVEVTESYDRLWREQVVSTWKQTHDYVQEARKRLAEFEEMSKSRPLTIEEQWERAKSTVDAKDADAALPFVREILKQDPNHLGANFALGATLLEQQDAAGVEHLEKVMELDPLTRGDACELIYNFYQARGQQSEAEKYRGYADEFYERQQRLYEQALNLTVHDRFEPHDLDNAALNRLEEQLAKTRGLAAAYLVRKIVDGDPIYVMGVLAAFTWKDGQSGKWVDDLINELANGIDFSRPLVFVSLDVKGFLTDTLTRVPNAQVYLRDRDVGVENRH